MHSTSYRTGHSMNFARSSASSSATILCLAIWPYTCPNILLTLSRYDKVRETTGTFSDKQYEVVQTEHSDWSSGH